MDDELTMKPKLLVTMLGKPNAVDRIIIRRRIDRLFLVVTDDELNQAYTLVEKFSSLGIQVSPIHIESTIFTKILSTILKVLDQRTLDDYEVEFGVSTGNTTIVIASCIAAAIVNASVFNFDNNYSIEISELWPSKLVNITHKKRQILSFLENYNDSINQKDISREIGIGQSSISRHIRDLEIAGYVTRTRIARKKVVKISELGSTILHHKQIRKRRIWDTYTFDKPLSIQTAG
ncbi:MAG: MarR family transcriptional regulator [Candidatus Thorarchaeota archaeon]